MQRCYVEDSRSMWLHPSPSHWGLWRAAILVKPMLVCAGGFTTAPFLPTLSSSLPKLPDKSQFTSFERSSHVAECSCCRHRITIMQACTCNMTNLDRLCAFYCSSSVSYHRVKGSSVSGSMCGVLSRWTWTATATSNMLLWLQLWKQQRVWSVIKDCT